MMLIRLPTHNLLLVVGHDLLGVVVSAWQEPPPDHRLFGTPPSAKVVAVRVRAWFEGTRYLSGTIPTI